MRRALRSLSRNSRGVTAIEFGIVAPVMMLLLMGLSDLAYQIYAQSILNGALQKAGRDATIQGAANNTTDIDNKVKTMVKKIAANATFVVTRKNYDSFSVIKPEPFIDNNSNGVRNPGECYTDINGNGQWDQDPGDDGQGGANDVTLYTMTVTYPRLFPVAGLFGWPSTQTISASTLLKNQPYASQTVVTPKQICT
ncbi:TadE/TadG family type IV pilus assembly protein [Sphingomonas panacisoli]|nr:TadE/TadG family type IV pilus assembly protein [Sphingomonas panacisoli]